jgi:hypothetical protein
MAQNLPEILDLINADKAARELGRIYNTEYLLRSDEEVQNLRKMRLEQQQIQLALQQAQQGAEAIKTIQEAGGRGK